jgi:hypothetical protein
MITVHVAPLTVSQPPLHPVKIEARAGEAVNVTVVLMT